MISTIIKKMTENLPDWLNPVYVKELRQTLHSKSFWIISGAIALVEFLIWYVATKQLSNIRENVYDISESQIAGAMLYALLVYVWLLGTVALLQPAISRWTEERQLDAVSPERTTDLSVWAILRGKLMLHVTLLIWVELLCLPLFFWLYPQVTDTALLRGYLCVASLSHLLILNLNIWSTIISMNMRIRRNVTDGMGFFGWAALSVGTIFILLYQGVFVAIFEYQIHAMELYTIAVFALSIPLVYGIFLLISVIKSEQCNRMFPARICGYVLAVLIVVCSWVGCEVFDESMKQTIILVALVLMLGYIAFQSVLAVFEPLFMPKRMRLDAPSNFLGKIIWYVNGTGAICAWLHLLVPFAVVSFLFFADVWDRDITSLLALMLVFVSYIIVYGALVSIVRIYFPKLPGGIVLVVLCAVGWILDLTLALCRLEKIAYISPASYCIQRVADLSQATQVAEVQNEIITFARPVLIVAWCGIVLMLVIATIAEMKRKSQSQSQSQ